MLIVAQHEHITAQKEPEILPYVLSQTSTGSSQSAVGEIRSFISAIVDGLISKYEKTQMELDEVIETIKQDFALDTLPIDTTKVRALHDLEEALVSVFEAHFDSKMSGLDPRALDATLRMIYLAMIDKYWIAHIDDMQYLRDKVGLYGYAQQDPLIIYKKEAFEKFEQLMFNIKQETIAIIFRTDFKSGQ